MSSVPSVCRQCSQYAVSALSMSSVPSVCRQSPQYAVSSLSMPSMPSVCRQCPQYIISALSMSSVPPICRQCPQYVVNALSMPSVPSVCRHLLPQETVVSLMVSVLAPSTVDRGFDPRSNQSKGCKICSLCLSAKVGTKTNWL